MKTKFQAFLFITFFLFCNAIYGTIAVVYAASGGANSIDPAPSPTPTPTPRPRETSIPAPQYLQESIRLAFSGSTAEENGIFLQGAGFGAYPQAEVSYGAIPTDHAFAGATDGKGIIINAKPGEGVMIFSPRIVSPNAAMIRCSARTDSGNAAIVIAAIGDEPNLFISYNTPNNGHYFLGRYKRLTTFCTPPSTGFQPLVQIFNPSKTETLIAYIDNLEIYSLDRNHYYHGDFLDGDESDPSIISVKSGEEEITPTPVPFSSTTLEIPGLPDGAMPMEFVMIPAGSFTMGSPADEPNRDPEDENQHPVTITKPFYMGKYEVTQAQWNAIMGTNPSYFAGSGNLPVEQVSWMDCQEFIKKLNDLRQGIYRLPTEAEWEYACRAGTASAYYFGDDSSDPSDNNYLWWNDNSRSMTHDAGTKLPNAWGLYDMAGNVWEWCSDWFANYPLDSQIDPTGPESGSFRIIRGGCWFSVLEGCRSANRFYIAPEERYPDQGFRLVRVIP
ncbi:MAG: formylglycine-generating enzyme family protein [Candidatus Omnitrophota bacterium]